MGSFKVIKTGLFTTIQDYGRYGYQQYGVPVSGVMDSYSYEIGNILVGNDEKEAVLEVTLVGPKLEFQSDTVIAITGGNLSPSINGHPITMWESHYVRRGDYLEFGKVVDGCRSYISFAGGIVVPKIMGSKSTFIGASLGGYKGRVLKSEDIIEISSLDNIQKEYIGRSIDNKYIPKYTNHHDISIIINPQEKYFTSKGIDNFFNSEYTVSNDISRMGYRLKGEKIETIKSSDIISDGIAPGAIQISSDGQPIIMLADRQTTGGYAKIGTVISTDLNKLGQAKPGDTIRFNKISIDEAHKRLKEMKSKINAIKEEIKNYNDENKRRFRIKINKKIYNVEVQEIS